MDLVLSSAFHWAIYRISHTMQLIFFFFFSNIMQKGSALTEGNSVN